LRAARSFALSFRLYIRAVRPEAGPCLALRASLAQSSRQFLASHCEARHTCSSGAVSPEAPPSRAAIHSLPATRRKVRTRAGTTGSAPKLQVAREGKRFRRHSAGTTGCAPENYRPRAEKPQLFILTSTLFNPPEKIIIIIYKKLFLLYNYFKQLF
jgi:hypothetical protein